MRECRRHAPPRRWTPPLAGILAEPGHQVTVEVLVAVGFPRYGLHHQLTAAQTRLARRGIRVSLGELSHLSDEFLVRWSHWFETTRPRWGPALGQDVILMIDGTQDAGGRVTYRARDAKTGLTLHAATLEAESTPEVARFLEAVKAAFGTPRPSCAT